MQTVGKLFQVTGLVLLPLAMVMLVTSGIRAPTGNVTVSAMLLMMLFGVALFLIGRLLEGYGRA